MRDSGSSTADAHEVRRFRGARRAVAVSWAAASCAACSPALDWREVRPAGTAVSALMPCKPNISARTVALAGQDVRLSMLACKAQSWTWAIASADVADPARVGGAVKALGDGTVANVRGRILSSGPAAVRGATPHAANAAVLWSGLKPDGTAVSGRFVVFSHGTQVFQAIVMGAEPPGEAAAPFFESLRAAP
jgi:hypothetical protein